jgi:RNA polymerase sigma factor (sigma-70 family)
LDSPAVRARIESCTGLALHIASKYARKYPRVSLEDLAQDCFVSLVRAAQLFRNRKGGCPWSAFALRCVLQAAHLHVNKFGWPRPEVSLDAFISSAADETQTWQDVVDSRRAARELSSAPGHERDLGQMASVRELIANLKTLTPREKRILQLRASGLENVQIAKRLHRSKSIIATEATTGIQKIRNHLVNSLA